MAEMKTPVVHIRYKSEYGTLPEETQILATDPLTPVQLPVLSAKDYQFVGWVHVNPDGHESSLSERMIVSNDWLIPTGSVNEFYVIFTAKWVNDRPKGTVNAEVYTGEYVVVPNSTEQTLPTADKLMQRDVVVTAIPYGESKITPQTYGAVGDGVADDTEAFKSALAENRVVFVPGGTYKLSDELTVYENCCLELSQDVVLNFTQTDKNCITMLRLANIKGNHATINVPYTFSANVINCDTEDDEATLDPDNMANSNNTAVPPFTKWSPQWKMTRYVTDINICKPTESGRHESLDGKCYGTAIYLHCNKEDFVSYMWGVSMSGVRIAGGFEYGIRAYNIGETEYSWNHDMRIEAVIDACKVGVSMENCHYARLAVTIQPRKADNGTVYAENGIKLTGSKGIDLTSSRVWDWNEEKSLWSDGNKYQHIAMYGQCRGLILDDFLYYEQSSTDIRSLIYTDTPSNLENMTILQEPITRWFKPTNGEPYFSNGLTEKKLTTDEEFNSKFDAHFKTDFIKSFTDVLAVAKDTDGTVLNGVGYKIGARLHENGTLTESPYYGYTGFIPCAKGSTIYAKDLSFDVGDDFAKVIFYDANKNYINHVNRGNIIKGNNYYAAYTSNEDGFALTINSISNNNNVAYARFTFYKTGFGEHPMMAVDEEIKYTLDGFLADGINIKAENVVGSPMLTSPNGTVYMLSVNDSGVISTTKYTS